MMKLQKHSSKLEGRNTSHFVWGCNTLQQDAPVAGLFEKDAIMVSTFGGSILFRRQERVSELNYTGGGGWSSVSQYSFHFHVCWKGKKKINKTLVESHQKYSGAIWSLLEPVGQEVGYYLFKRSFLKTAVKSTLFRPFDHLPQLFRECVNDRNKLWAFITWIVLRC